jgi:hypothetical protein
MRSVTSFLRDQRGSMPADAAKAVIAIAFLSLIGVHMMGNRIASEEKDKLAGLTHVAAKGKPVDARTIDQITTGSLATAANGVRFDPCELPPRR